MTPSNETEVEFPKSLRDLFPSAAQALYIEAYRRSFAESKAGHVNQMSHESVAARDAWHAVRLRFIEDPITHKWRAIGEAALAHVEKPGLLSRIKKMFAR